MNTVNKAGAVLAGLLAAAGSVSAAAPDERTYGFIEGFLVHHEERIPERDKAFGGRVGLGFPLATGANTRTALELGVFTNPIKRKNAPNEHQSGLMLDLVYAWNTGIIDPYVFGGVGGVQEFTDALRPAAELGIGTMIDIGHDVALRIGASAQSVFNDDVRADKDQFTDYRAIVGLAVPFGAGTPPPPPPPADSDGDGVPDSRDRCPAQPAPTADGCPAPIVPAAPPKDTDGDGIDDAKDECPGTLEGLQVDANGCVNVTAASPQQVVLKGVTFVTGSAQLTPDAKVVLDEAYAALAGQANLRVELGGHTDSVGSDALNQSLSQRRAESVRKYLVDKGIAADRLSAKGYGESQPIADNKTKEGRQENRRVVFKILN